MNCFHFQKREIAPPAEGEYQFQDGEDRIHSNRFSQIPIDCPI